MEERLQKVMAQAGVASRRKSEELIAKGKVKVNGQVITEPGCKVDPAKDTIEVDGRLIRREKHAYYLLYKPVGYITSMDDQFDRPIVLDLMKGVPERLHSVGRLDYDTEGLLLLTNDGGLTYTLTHPSHQVEKTYLAKVKGFVSNDALRKLEEGVMLEDGKTAPAKARLRSGKRDYSIVEITIHEGRNRQVRRMFDQVGYPVLKLKRVQLGPLTLGALKPGEFRPLSRKEVSLLKRIEKIVRS